MQGDSANGKQRILVLGAGELGWAMLRGLAAQASPDEIEIAVLLRPSTADAVAPAKRAEVDAIRALGIAIEPADLIAVDVAALAAIFERYDMVIGCVGFAAGRGIQRKLTEAVLAAGVGRYIP